MAVWNDNPVSDRQRPGPIRTLVVDDSVLMLKTMARILAMDSNFTLISTATDGEQAIQQAAALAPELVLMDVRMPRLDGLQATRRIKEFACPPAIIIISSDDAPATQAQARAHGADGFVSKAGDIPGQLFPLLQALFPSSRRDSLQAPEVLPCPGTATPNAEPSATGAAS